MPALRTPVRHSGLTRKLLAAAGDRGQKTGFGQAGGYFARISNLDYGSRLTKRFDRGQMKELLADLRRSLPELNRNVFRETNIARLTSVASDFGVTLRVQPLPGQGLGVRGFYLNDSAFSARPLIVLNAANPPLTVAAAFWHEIGHHLTQEIYGKSPDPMYLNISGGSEAHLDDPRELLADIVMTLGAYPASTAKYLFGVAKPPNDSEGLVKLVSKASGHVKSVSGFEVSAGGPLKKKLQMVASMIHIARLRIALLQEYGL